MLRLSVYSLIFLSIFGVKSNAQTIHVSESGWSRTSANATIFRKNSIVSNDSFQYISFYDDDKKIVIGKRPLISSNWDQKKLSLTGHPEDAHRSISMALDGAGFLHLAWDHHNSDLKYTISQSPGSLDFEPSQSMTKNIESSVTYPEFYRLPNGNLLFLYRDGSSGNGNLIINQFDISTRLWHRVQSNLIDGEGSRNAYWQAGIDRFGRIHISWVWRETPDVSSNHDLCYAVSDDGGMNWKNSKGKLYSLPITIKTAEIIQHIPQNAELINQTSMTNDENGNPVIATYWRETSSKFPQYQIIRWNENWEVYHLKFRKADFKLSGGGTKRIPISRPQIITWEDKGKSVLGLIFRDEALGSKPMIAISFGDRFKKWELVELNDQNLGQWEPSYDIDLWKSRKILNLYSQQVGQGDGEIMVDRLPSPVNIISWKPGLK